MTPDEAAALLEIDTDPTDVELRDAYRRLIRRAHPDHGGSADRTTLLIEAYRVLRARTAAPEPPAAAPGPAEPDVVADASVALTAPHEEVFDLLIDRLATIGDLTSADDGTGFIEAVVGGVHTLTISLQGRAGHVEVMCTLHSPGGHDPPDLGALVGSLVG